MVNFYPHLNQTGFKSQFPPSPLHLTFTVRESTAGNSALDRQTDRQTARIFTTRRRRGLNACMLRRRRKRTTNIEAIRKLCP